MQPDCSPAVLLSQRVYTFPSCFKLWLKLNLLLPQWASVLKTEGSVFIYWKWSYIVSLTGKSLNMSKQADTTKRIFLSRMDCSIVSLRPETAALYEIIFLWGDAMLCITDLWMFTMCRALTRSPAKNFCFMRQLVIQAAEFSGQWWCFFSATQLNFLILEYSFIS